MAEQRDYVMARLAAASATARYASEAIDGCVSLFLDDGDKKGGDRREALEVILDLAGDLSRSIELAQAGMEGMSSEELSEGEPDLEEETSDDGTD
jgi:hypothetical protein